MELLICLRHLEYVWVLMYVLCVWHYCFVVRVCVWLIAASIVVVVAILLPTNVPSKLLRCFSAVSLFPKGFCVHVSIRPKEFLLTGYGVRCVHV